MYIAISNSITSSSQMNAAAASGGGGSFDNTYSMAFDGVDDYVNISNPIPLGLTSISFWMKSTDIAGAKGITNGLGQLNFIGTSPIVRLNSTNYRYFADQVANFDGNWHHWFLLIAGSGQYDIASSRLFVDGVEVLGNTAISNGLPLAWGVSQIGKGFYGVINASIDEFAIWQSDETANISTIYNSGVPTDLASLNPLAWYRMGDNGSYKSPQWLEPQNSNKDKLSNFSFEFDGVGDNISLSSNIDLGTLNTVSFWIKRNDTAIAQPLGNTTAWSDFLVRLQTTQISFGSTSFVFNDATTLSLVNQTTNWTHLMFVRNGANCNLFVNGVDRDGAKTNSNAAAVNRFRTIGSPGDGSTWNFNGSIDEIALWTSDESSNISAIYNGGEPTTLPSGAVAHYKMGEEATFSTNWTVPDAIGSADGTSANMTIEDRVGEAPNSTGNSLSYNMVEADRETDVPS